MTRSLPIQSVASEKSEEIISTRLLSWLRENGGSLDDRTFLSRDTVTGWNLRTTQAVPSKSRIVTVPHSCALSYLNALVDDSLLILKSHATTLQVEVVGVFYLMAQWLNREQSFWKPFLDILTPPSTGFSTPFYFDKEDFDWLQGTDLFLSFEKREAKWRENWRDTTAILESAGMDVTEYTWDLCKWAATIFSSRSLGSASIKPRDGQEWTAYRSGSNGREKVSLDFSKVEETRKDFPVLIPVMDCLNHNPDAQVVWAFEVGRFELSVESEIKEGQELYNNYGPKCNAELLMGYGFCIESNPFDCVLETLKPPAEDLLDALRKYQPEFFDKAGLWKPEAATFRLKKWDSNSGDDVWTCIPLTLIGLFDCFVRIERGLDISQDEIEQLTSLDKTVWKKHLPRIAYLISSSLVPKADKLSAVDASLPSSPANDKQRYAQIYRKGQLDIISSLRAGFSHYLRTLRPPPMYICTEAEHIPRKSYLLTLEESIDIMGMSVPLYRDQFVAGIKAAYGIDKVEDINGSSIEDQIWLLLCCFGEIMCWDHDRLSSEQRHSLFASQIKMMEQEFGLPQQADDSDDEDSDPNTDEESAGLLQIVKEAAGSVDSSVLGTNIWEHKMWTPAFLLDWGMRIVKSQGMMMRIAEDEVRFVLYLPVHDHEQNNDQ